MTGTLSMGANNITNLATPVLATDAATKNYVDSVAVGINVKTSCAAATTANITLSGAQTIDGVSVVAGNRVLVKNQTASADNGIYVASASAWTRATDADTWAELIGAMVFISAGTINGLTSWISNTTTGGTIGVTAVTFVQFGASQSYTAGTGITLSGNQFSLTTPVTVSSGGTGVSSLTGVPWGNGGSAMTVATGAQISGQMAGVGAANQLLQSNGASAPTWTSTPRGTSFQFNGSASGSISINAGASPSNQTYSLPGSYPSTSGQVLSSTTGGVMSWITSSGSSSYIANVADYGASSSASAATNTAAIQAAIDTGKSVYIPSGNYAISSKLTISTPGQIITGAGDSAKLIAQPGFSGDGVFGTTTDLYPGPHFSNFYITCVQPNTSSRASLNTYPPAINFNNTSRYIIENMTITLFQYGISAVGSLSPIPSGGKSGQWVINNVRMGCFGIGINAQHAFDTVVINELHYWCFDMYGSNLADIFFDKDNIGIYVAQIDGITIANSFLINGGRSIYVDDSTSSTGSNGIISNCYFDFFPSLYFNKARFFEISSCTFVKNNTSLDNSQRMLTNVDTNLTISNCVFDDGCETVGYGGDGVIATYASQTYLGNTTIGNCFFARTSIAAAVPFLYFGAKTQTTVNGCIFNVRNYTTYTNQYITVANTAKITMTGNSFTEYAGSGVSPGNAILLASDNFCVITGNNFNQWNLSTNGVTPTNSVIWPNAISSVNYFPQSPSRTYSTVYTNNTPSPLTVNITFSYGAADYIEGKISANGGPLTVIASASMTGATGSNHSFMSFPVPPFGSYAIYRTNSASIMTWIESY